MPFKYLAILALLAFQTGVASAQTLKLLTAGAFKAVVLDILPAFEAQSGVKVEVTSDTAGGLVKQIEAGAPFDVVIVTHDGIQRLASHGAVAADSARDVARVGIGVGIRAGAPVPALATVEQFTLALRAAKGIAYIDPASGGSSGIYLDGLFRQLGIADEVKSKAILVPRGLAADRVLSGEADLALQQASEILPVKGVVLAGLLPESIQSETTYAAGVSARTASRAAADQLMQSFGAALAMEAIRSRGMTAMP
ncbi:MAG: molybdate ABC transporter substrate-binding protein [Leptothrix sp. (in: b-proteobacteria)]